MDVEVVSVRWINCVQCARKEIRFCGLCFDYFGRIIGMGDFYT
jgi:hypothetical protein